MAALCLVLVAVIGLLVHGRYAALQDLDTSVGTGPQQLTYGHHWLYDVAHVIELLFSTWWMAAMTALAVGALVARGHRRAAIWTTGVMVATSLTTELIKIWVGRTRPTWDHPVETLRSYSFPSGHSSGVAAAASIAIVLVVMLVRRRPLRRALVLLFLALAALVGADRIFLGVHNLSDVLAGFLLGAGIAQLGLALFDPAEKSIALTHEPLPEIGAGPERLLAVVLNPSKVDDVGGFRQLVQAMALESGWTKVLWWETTPEDTGYSMAHEAAVSGANLVVAIGGDGTIRAVCEELAGTGVPVGIVPAGTGNLLARNLDIPLYLRAAVDVALNGQDRAIDMVKVSGDGMEDAVFLVMAGMGFDAAIMEGVNEDFKAKLGWLAYVWSGLRSLMFPAIRVEISVDGGAFTRHRARTIVVGNVGHLQAGMPLLPDAAIDDGMLDVVLLYPRRFLSWVPLAARVMTRNKRTDELITRMTGRSVIVRTGSDTPRQLDGDLIAPGKELRAECLHGRLLVRVPR